MSAGATAGRTTTWAVGLVGLLVWLTRTDAGLPGPPADRSWGGWRDWAAATPVVDQAAVTLRAAAIAAATWLLLLLVLGVLARGCHAARTLHVLDRLSFGLLRRVLLPMAGATMALVPTLPAGASPTGGAGLAFVVAAAPGEPQAGWAVLRPVADDVAPPLTGPSTTSVGPPPTVAPPVPPRANAAPRPTTTTTLVLPPAPAPYAPAPATGPPTPAPATWVVQPGDHLWSIAEQTLTQAWGRAPSSEAVAEYWAATIAANHDRLVLPGEPDLILPGQTFTLPSTPAAPV